MDNSSPLVSIACITYNHAPFIRECLDGFLRQKCNFSFEVLIHDDASTDGTEEIIREYERKHPDIIKPIYETENQWSKGRRGSAIFNFPRASGKYIALCEGDDYWTDPLKLQKQVDFLKANKEYSICVHQALIINEANGKPIRLNTYELKNRDYDLEEIVKGGGDLFATNSMLFRSEYIVALPSYFNKVEVADFPLMIHLALSGKVHYSNERMSVYRLRSNGSWTARMRKKPSLLALHYQNLALMLEEINEKTNLKHDTVLKREILKYNCGFFILANIPFLYILIKKLLNIPLFYTLIKKLR